MQIGPLVVEIQAKWSLWHRSITTPKNPTFQTFYLHFSISTYKSFSSSLFIISATILSCSFSISVPIIISSINTTIFPILIKSLNNLFIIAWNVASELVNPKNITIGLKNPSIIVKAIFHLSPFLILTLLYLHLRSIFVNTLLVPIFSDISNIRGRG